MGISGSTSSRCPAGPVLTDTDTRGEGLGNCHLPMQKQVGNRPPTCHRFVGFRHPCLFACQECVLICQNDAVRTPQAQTGVPGTYDGPLPLRIKREGVQSGLPNNN